MEKLIKELIEKHKLERAEAAEAIKLVTDYLKSKNPVLEKLIDHALEKNKENLSEHG